MPYTSPLCSLDEGLLGSSLQLPSLKFKTFFSWALISKPITKNLPTYFIYIYISNMYVYVYIYKHVKSLRALPKKRFWVPQDP